MWWSCLCAVNVALESGISVWSTLVFASKNSLNLSIRFSFRFGYFDKHKDCAEHHETREEIKCWTLGGGKINRQLLFIFGSRFNKLTRSPSSLHHGESFCNNKHQSPVKHHGDSRCNTFNVWCKKLSHHHPRNRSETQREADDEQNDATKRKDGNFRHVCSTFFQAEIHAEHDQTKAHHNTRLKQENTTAGFLNEKCWCNGHHDLHNTNNDGTKGWIESRTSGFKNTLRVKDDCVDSGELLEQHERQRDDQSHEVGAYRKQVRKLRVASHWIQIGLNVLQRSLCITLTTPEPLECRTRILTWALCEMKTTALVNPSSYQFPIEAQTQMTESIKSVSECWANKSFVFYLLDEKNRAVGNEENCDDE